MMKRLAFALGLVLFVQTIDRAGKEGQPGGVTVDVVRRAVIVDAKVAPRKLPESRQGLPIELVAGWGAPKGKKAHEIVVAIDVEPIRSPQGTRETRASSRASPPRAGPPKDGDPFPKAEGPVVNVYFEVPDGAGGAKKVAIEKVLMDPATKKPRPR